MKNEHLLKTHTDADADMSLRTMFAKCHEAIKELDLPTQTWTDGVRMLKSINGRSVVPACGTTLSVCYLDGRGNAVFSFVGDSLGFVIRQNGDVEMLGAVGHNPPSIQKRQSVCTTSTKHASSQHVAVHQGDCNI